MRRSCVRNATVKIALGFWYFLFFALSLAYCFVLVRFKGERAGLMDWKWHGCQI